MKNITFGNPQPDTVSIKQVAQKLSVSTATIHNWIKTHHLSQTKKGFITQDSLTTFIQSELPHRLHSRANKSLKDTHDHKKITDWYLRQAQDTVNYKNLGDLYQNTLSNAYRNKEGIYYTPKHIVKNLFNPCIPISKTHIFCDPCCGSGNFIIHALKLGFKPENIYGFDTDPVAIAITKKRILEYSGYNSHTIQQGDFLECVCKNTTMQFDFIATNPPWGKKLPKNIRSAVAKKLGAGQSTDTCALFFYACWKCLKNDGELSLLLPDSFFNIAVFQEVRETLLDYKILRCINYNRAFDKLLAKAYGIHIQKTYTDTHHTLCVHNDTTFYRPQKSFAHNPKSIINISCNNLDSAVISHLLSMPHTTLKNNATWALGIVTGNNKKFITHTHKQDYIPVYKGTDISHTGIKPCTNFMPNNMDLYQQVAPLDIYQSAEKIVYKFISSKLDFYCDTEQKYFLNSANMLVLHPNFPIKAKIIADVFSSNFMNWIFTHIFDTHKILRGDLESLPIYTEALSNMQHFSEQQYIEKLGLETINGTYRIKTANV